ncbi:MAG: hypothetical protein IKS51_00065 [Erysipelotrichaceae bacterium]|nr:hypothetical protein [Erysipelotrichaceae bacterium]
MNCPYCNEEMVNGYIQSANQIYFNKGNKARFFASGDLRSRGLTRVSLRAPYIRSYLCENCQKIILDINRVRK